VGRYCSLEYKQVESLDVEVGCYKENSFEDKYDWGKSVQYFLFVEDAGVNSTYFLFVLFHSLSGRATTEEKAQDKD
jgi:hypothetical protein